MKIKNKYDKGKIGEQIVSNFFDTHLSKFFSFPNPKTKSNAQVADVLIWMNRVVFLIEVKTRNEGSTSIESWVRNKIREAINQITKNYKRIKENEVIYLHNSFYQTSLDCSGVQDIIGLVILVHDEKCCIYPTNSSPEIYNYEVPLHVISWNDLCKMIYEIDTVPDFYYYLSDRYKYTKIADIHLGNEINALGYYKSHSNKFPLCPIDFSSSKYWNNYQSSMAKSIEVRNEHNRLSGWIDKLEQNFTKQRKLFDGYPLGLYFAWEIGSISRRERAYLGEKLDTIQSWFDAGNTNRKFAWLNGSTGNWILFYYSKSLPTELHKELQRLVELKLIKEIDEDSFDYGVYGFGFQVSKIFPPKLLGLVSSIMISVDYIKGKYSKIDLQEARELFGNRKSRQIIKIEEFPKT